MALLASKLLPHYPPTRNALRTVSAFYAGCASILGPGASTVTVTVTAAVILTLISPVVAGAAPVIGFGARTMMHGMYSDSTLQRQAGAAAQEKRARTPAQKKIDSQLLYALYRKRGEARAKGVPSGELGVRFDDKGRAIVSVRARVTKTVLAKIKSMGGEIISSSVRYNDIRAHMPLEKLEGLAALKDVFAIMPAEEATTNSVQQ